MVEILRGCGQMHGQESSAGCARNYWAAKDWQIPFIGSSPYLRLEGEKTIMIMMSLIMITISIVKIMCYKYSDVINVYFLNITSKFNLNSNNCRDDFLLFLSKNIHNIQVPAVELSIGTSKKRREEEEKERIWSGRVGSRDSESFHWWNQVTCSE